MNFSKQFFFISTIKCERALRMNPAIVRQLNQDAHLSSDLQTYFIKDRQKRRSLAPRCPERPDVSHPAADSCCGAIRYASRPIKASQTSQLCSSLSKEKKESKSTSADSSTLLLHPRG